MLNFDDIQKYDRFKHLTPIPYYSGHGIDVSIPANSEWLVLSKFIEDEPAEDGCDMFIQMKGDGAGAHLGHLLTVTLTNLNANMERLPEHHCGGMSK